MTGHDSVSFRRLIKFALYQANLLRRLTHPHICEFALARTDPRTDWWTETAHIYIHESHTASWGDTTNTTTSTASPCLSRKRRTEPTQYTQTEHRHQRAELILQLIRIAMWAPSSGGYPRRDEFITDNPIVSSLCSLPKYHTKSAKPTPTGWDTDLSSCKVRL